MVEMAHFDVIVTSSVKMTSYWILKSAYIVFRHVSWGLLIKLPSKVPSKEVFGSKKVNYWYTGWPKKKGNFWKMSAISKIFSFLRYFFSCAILIHMVVIVKEINLYIIFFEFLQRIKLKKRIMKISEPPSRKIM